MNRILLASAAGLAIPFAAAAQDFNAAPPNASGQQPAFEGQTRAPVLADDIPLATTDIATGLDHPWGLTQLPDGTWLVTERAGNLRRIAADGTVSEPISGLPEVDARGQGGLLDVVLAPDFESSRRIFWSFAEARGEGKNATAVATGTLNAEMTAVEGAAVIWQQQPAWESDKHFGSRLVWDRDGMLFVTLGERSNPESRAHAQELDNHLGKLVRITPEGQPAQAEPAIPGALPDIYAMGLRNVQAAALDAEGTLWTVEHGPEGGDELNHVEAGRNYGWPVITYGQDYSGAPIGEGITAREGMEQPVYYWDPVIAPSGLAIYDGAMFPEWQGDFLIGGLVAQALVRLDMQDGRVAGEARHLQGIGRVRDVEVAADGSLMLLIDADRGRMVRVSRQ